MASRNKLTFKQYLSSKEKLREAIKNTPKQTIQYTVTKYCKLVIGESKESKNYLSFKPKNKIIVDWLYEDINNPTPLKILVDGKDNEYVTYWKGEKLTKWLRRNTNEDFM